MVRVFNFARVFSLISFMAIFSLVPPSGTMLLKDNPAWPTGPDKLGVHNAVVFPAHHLKKRKAPLAPPFGDESVKPILDEKSVSIRSVSAPKMFSYHVVQQPESDPFYVSPSENQVTEFGLAQKYGNVGLIAHNNLAGNLFNALNLGQEVQVVYGDGHTVRYTVSAIYRFRAMEPTKTESRFVDLNSSQILSATELFNQMYTGAPHLTFQTCIEAKGDASWGRLFVIATPVVEAE